MSRNQPRTTINTIAGECIAVRLRMLNRAVTNIYDDALRPLGVRVSQMNILVAAGMVDIARPAEICEQLHLDVSTLSRNVERMKSRGWLEVIHGEDRRAQPFRLTPAGRRLLEKALPKWETAQQQAMGILGDSIFDGLEDAIERLKSLDR